MSKAEYPVTQAVRFLRSKKIDFVPYVYAYEEHGGTARFAECAGKPEHQVIKRSSCRMSIKKVWLF